jgi:hypothetical protein
MHSQDSIKRTSLSADTSFVLRQWANTNDNQFSKVGVEIIWNAARENRANAVI